MSVLESYSYGKTLPFCESWYRFSISSFMCNLKESSLARCSTFSIFVSVFILAFGDIRKQIAGM